MKKAIVVGSGAAGAAAAAALQGTFAVTVLEKGHEFRRFSRSLKVVERFKRLGLLVSAREIGILFPEMRTRRADDGMILVWGSGTGGTTTLSAGNALRMDHDLKAIGIDLDREFEELSRRMPISTDHTRRWKDSTQRLFDVCSSMGLGPLPTPKMADSEKCTNCGRCILGCPTGAKWDARRFLDDARNRGAEVLTGCSVSGLAVEKGKAAGVVARVNGRRRLLRADLVVLAAGGFGTPVILDNSGILCSPTLFVDPVLCVAAEWPGARQNQEIPMPFVVQRENYIMSPYFDFLSYFFNKAWKPLPENIVSLMIKLADEPAGTVSKKGVRKSLSRLDNERLSAAILLCQSVLAELGIGREKTFLGSVNAGHPGGNLPLTAAESTTLHHAVLPANVYVADATLLPKSLGNPPILTIMALAGKVSRTAAEKFA